MKLKTQPEAGLTLTGLIVGIMLVVIGVMIITSLIRAAKIPPRELPEDVESCLTNAYPEYFGANQPPWPVKFVPRCLDISTPDPNAGIYEKVLLGETFVVQYCIDGSLTNWGTMFTWVCWPKTGASLTQSRSEQSMTGPILHQFDTFIHETATIQMKPDYSGFDIIPSEVVSNIPNARMFWRVIP